MPHTQFRKQSQNQAQNQAENRSPARFPPAAPLTDRICLVTGASSGIGRETARALARRGATVIAVSRAQGDGAAVAAALRAETGNAAVRFVPADLSSLEEVRRLAAEVHAEFGRLDVLVNNAGAFFERRRLSADGHELTFALNHLGCFALTLRLRPALEASGRLQGEPARVVVTASDAARFARIHWRDPMLADAYNGWRAYGQSKLANVMFAAELARRWRDARVAVSAFHPGFVDTGFGAGSGVAARVMGAAQALFGRSPERGADTGVYLAVAPEAASARGGYFKDRARREAPAAARDADQTERLWRLSLQLTGLDETGADATTTPGRGTDRGADGARVVRTEAA